MTLTFPPISIENFEGCSTVGIYLQASMDTAQSEVFEQLWETFIPLCEASNTLPKGQYPLMFGISVMTSPTNFTYWATQKYTEDGATPAHMERIAIPAGLYARLEIPSIEAMTGAFEEIFTHWLPQQNEYGYDEERCSFELYDERYLTKGTFTLYVPVAKEKA